jgi:hypothetical protein
LNLKDFFVYLFIPVYRPNRYLPRLNADRHRVEYAVLALLIISLLLLSAFTAYARDVQTQMNEEQVK